MKYEKMIDHTYLKPEGTEKEIPQHGLHCCKDNLG